MAKPRVVTSNNVVPTIMKTPKAIANILEEILLIQEQKQVKQQELKSFLRTKTHGYPTQYTNNRDLLAKALCVDTVINLLAAHAWDDTDEMLRIQ